MIHPTTVEMVYIDNDALVSDQGCHISNSPEWHGLNDCALCLRSTSSCSRCRNSTYPTCSHCAPKVEVPPFEVLAMPIFDVPAPPHAVYNLNVPKFNLPMKSSSPAAVVADNNLEPQEVRSTFLYVCDRSGMQSKVVYGLNTSVVASFAQVIQI